MTSSRAGLLLAAVLPGLAHAYTFVFNTQPTQCENASLSIVGDDGVPPYNVVMLAYGSAPGGNEIRKIIDHSFNDKTTSVLMAFPANAGFVAVVSDSRAFGSGGTTISINTGSSDDNSCLPQPGSLSPGFTFGFAYPDETASLTQCQTKRITYSNSTQGDVKFYGVVPGGTSFEIPVNNPQPFDGGSHVFSWQVNVPKFIDILLLAGDARGRGSGGSTPTINIGESDETSCLQGSSITSTPGTPAGGVHPTSSSGGSNTPQDDGGGSNIGAIVGGVIGGLVFIILVLAGALFFMWKRRRARRDNKIREKPDLTDDPRPLAVSNDDSLQPEPFIVPPSVTSASRPGTPSEATGPAGAVPPSAWARGHSFERRYSGGQMSGLGRPLSLATTTDEGGGGPASSIGGLSAWERKHGASGGPQLRPVNVVQHEDGGEVVGENDTVELPPAYGNIRPRASPKPDEGGSQ